MEKQAKTAKNKMPDGIAYQNKDILTKVLVQNYKDKSFKVFCLDLPKIKEVLPANLPTITAKELRSDNIFVLEDDSILIVDYESTVKSDDFLKYLRYILLVLEALKGKAKKVRFAVIYTCNIENAPSRHDWG